MKNALIFKKIERAVQAVGFVLVLVLLNSNYFPFLKVENKPTFRYVILGLLIICAIIYNIIPKDKTFSEDKRRQKEMLLIAIITGASIVFLFLFS